MAPFHRRTGDVFLCKSFSLFLLFLAFTFYGCASPRVMMDTKDLTKYKKVFLLTPERDPRSVTPIVAIKLKDLGFDVITVTSEDRDSFGGSQGSGFVVSPEGHIMTCAHVVEAKEQATVWLQGRRVETTVICKDKEKDLAILKPTDPGTFYPLQFDSESEVRMGQDLYTMGFPLSRILGNSPRLQRGLVNSTVGLKDNPSELQVSVEAQHGNSGGPLLDGRGMVVGVIQKKLANSSISFAMKATAAKEFAENCSVKFVAEGGPVPSRSFEEVKNSVVQVYAGLVTEESLNEPALVAVIYYQSFWDLWYRFRVFNIDFYDMENKTRLLRAGQYRDNPASTEASVIDATFGEIKTKLFPETTRSPASQ